MEFGLIGEHLSHSFSKTIHEDLTGKPYDLMEIPREGLDAFMKARDFKGINVTIPYKQAVIPYLDDLSEAARETGAVNAIVNRDGRLTGHNTDVDGFRYLLEKAGIALKGRKVVILGAGGAAKAVAFVARALGAASITNAVRHPSGDGQVSLSSPELFSDVQVIINATPAGMSPDIFDIPLKLEGFKNLEAVADCIYNPLRTRLLLDADGLGVRTSNGLAMLVEQARKAAELFHGMSIPITETDRIVKEHTRMKRNIVLYGMPASGKTTLARELSSRTGRPYIDTDELVVEKAGRPVSEIFAEAGEAGFRKMESEAIRSIAGRQGVIISTGGGAVMNPENVAMLRHNGEMVHLVRDLSLLEAGDGRPLSRDREGLKRLYDMRIKTYEAIAERTIVNNTTIEDAIRMLADETLDS